MQIHSKNNTQLIYLSPINFNDLVALEDVRFNIKLLICSHKGKSTFDNVYIDSKTVFPQLTGLIKPASIQEIVDVLEKENLILLEYKLEAPKDRIYLQSISAAGDDVFAEFVPSEENREKLITVLSDAISPKLNIFTNENFKELKGNTLYQYNENSEVKPIARNFHNKTELIDFIIQIQQESIISEEEYNPLNIIYFS